MIKEIISPERGDFMIVNFSVSNFKSFGKEQFFTTIPGRYRNKTEHVLEEKNYKTLKFSALFGGNASGKSNFVDALSVFKRIVLTGKIPKTYRDYSFRLNNIEDKISKFELVIGIEEKMFAYGLAIDFSKSELKNEYLYLISKNNDELVYDIDKVLNINQYNKKLLSKNNFERFDIYAEDLEKNQILLHKLFNSKNETKDCFFNFADDVYGWFKNTLTIIKPNSTPINIIGQFTESEKKKEINVSVIELIKSFDTGITNYKHEALDIESFLKKIKLDIPNEKMEDFLEFEEVVKNIKKNEFIDANIADSYYKITGGNEKENGKVEELTFEHCFNSSAKFNFNEESDGTMRLIELVNVLYSSQFKNKVFVIDELDRSLHPNLTLEFINNFLKIAESRKIQMIITTHETNVMDLNMLRQDEVWLIERDCNGMSNLISLNKYNIRSDKVLDKDYLKGRYGGIPKINKLLKVSGIYNG